MNHGMVPYNPVVSDLWQEHCTDQLINAVNNHHAEALHRSEIRRLDARHVRKEAALCRQINKDQCARKNRTFQGKLYGSVALAVSFVIMTHVPIVSVCCLIGAVGLTGAWIYEWTQCRKRR